jgi:spore coat polysaccharide biosynthesis predicted glycosyltransferase SpsG/GNAT superfamily N-acetyltransferase
MPASRAILFRCDGDDRIGAGHVSRCIQIALAMQAAGHPVAFAGSYEGVAADLLAHSEQRVEEPDPDRPAGIPAGAEAAVVDSYEIPFAEIEAAARAIPTAFIADGESAPVCTAVLSYHLDAAERMHVSAETPAILGAAYAPVRPGCVAARRPRGLEHGLVTIGGGGAGAAILEQITKAMLELGIELFVAADAPELAQHARVQAGRIAGGLLDRIAWADVAASGAGSTPYELACAGVPALLITLADNQAPIGTAFDSQGIAIALDARDGLDAPRLADAVQRLAEERIRHALSTTGPARIDGYGAFRARDALTAAFEGRPVPAVVTYRPATTDDAGRLLAWRNDPDTRAVSREQHEVKPEEHAAWLARTLTDARRTLLIAEADDGPCATVRFDRSGAEAEISITVAPEQRGRGLGSQVIKEATELYLHAHPEVGRAVAEVRNDNAPSTVAFARAGFGNTDEGDAEWTRLAASIAAWI